MTDQTSSTASETKVSVQRARAHKPRAKRRSPKRALHNPLILADVGDELSPSHLQEESADFVLHDLYLSSRSLDHLAAGVRARNADDFAEKLMKHITIEDLEEIEKKAALVYELVDELYRRQRCVREFLAAHAKASRAERNFAIG